MSDRTPPDDRSWWLTDNVLAGAYPGHWEDDEARAKVHRLLDAGVTLFLDLTERAELESYEHHLAGTGARRVNLPVRDMTVAPHELVEAAMGLIDDEVAAGGTVYVHCWGGRGRTGTILGCWLAREMGGPAALAHLADTRRALAVNRGPCPETREQRAFVEAWAAQRA